MFKILAVAFVALFAVAAAKPGVLAPVAYTAGVPVPVAAAAPVAYSAALTTAPVVAATSSQYVARNYNGFVAPYVAAPYVTGYPYSAAYVTY